MLDLPLVSIIIPVYNNGAGLQRALAAISQQDYPADKIETIVIDNGSRDHPETVAGRYEVIFLREDNYLNSPYSARNRGIETASGSVIILLDTTCAPVASWLSEGIKSLRNQEADLVGGNVEFEIHPQSSIGEMYDSLTNIRMEETIRRRNAAKTTNLFIKRSVFDQIGCFPEGLRSGGDVLWTKKATLSGLKLVFCKNAIAKMLPRGGRDLYKKQYRVAKGQPAVWKKERSLLPNLIKKVVLCWVPPNPLFLKSRIKESGNSFMGRKFIGLFFIGYSLRFVNAFGNIVGLFKKKIDDK